MIISNLHLRTMNLVIPSLLTCLRGPAWVSPPVNGWTSVYLGLEDRLDGTAEACTSSLSLAVLTVTLNANERFGWRLYEAGALVQQAQVQTGTDSAPQPLADLERLLPYCVTATTVDDLRTLLGATGEAAEALAKASAASQQARSMLEASLSMFRSLPPEIVSQLLERVQKQAGIPDDHPLLQAFKQDNSAMLDQVANAAAALQAQSDALAQQPRTGMEPTLRLLGEAATIPIPLDRLARRLGLEQRIPLSYSLLSDPEEDGWIHVIGEV